jgi:hypothetical protein
MAIRRISSLTDRLIAVSEAGIRATLHTIVPRPVTAGWLFRLSGNDRGDDAGECGGTVGLCLSGQRLIELHRLLQFLGWAEGNLLARLDLNRLTGRRVPTHPSGSCPDLEDA